MWKIILRNFPLERLLLNVIEFFILRNLIISSEIIICIIPIINFIITIWFYSFLVIHDLNFRWLSIVLLWSSILYHVLILLPYELRILNWVILISSKIIIIYFALIAYLIHISLWFHHRFISLMFHRAIPKP
jgi:hypothetical protein